MAEDKLYNVAKHYVWIIEKMEKTGDLEMLAELEEQRVMLHNRLLKILDREGVPYRDRERVTLLAFLITRDFYER